jgi:transposase
MARRGRPTVEIKLSGNERKTLERWARRHSSAQSLALRCRIVLACAEDRTNQDIASELRIHPVTVSKWRRRFAADRLDGLVDAPRPGAVRTINDDTVEAVVVDTLESAPADATHWSTRGLAAKHGISHQTVVRSGGRSVSSRGGRTPSSGPQIQALNRTAPTFPMLPTTPARATHDYQRNGTCDLFAALDIASGTVITDIRSSHTSDDFIAFLNKVNRNVPTELDVHVVLDNLSAHKNPKVQRRLLRHRRFHFHFTPTYGSWMNLVERWFSALTTKKLKRSAHCSAKELAADTEAWAATWNENPKPFVWHKTAEQILERLAGYCTAVTTDNISASS